MNRARWLLPVAALAVGMLAGGGTVALWTDGITQAPSIRAGYANLAVGDPGDLAPDAGTAWTLPADLLGDGTPQHPYLAPGETAIAAAQLDGVSQGNRGLAWSVPSGAVEVDGGELVAGLTVTVVAVDSPEQCTVDAVTTAADPLYRGPIGDLELGATELVSSAYSDGADPTTGYLCFGFTVGDWSATYTNTATVTGQNQGAQWAPVSAADQWNARLLPPAEAYVVDVVVHFDWATFRPGGAP